MSGVLGWNNILSAPDVGSSVDVNDEPLWSDMPLGGQLDVFLPAVEARPVLDVERLAREYSGSRRLSSNMHGKN